MENKDVKPDELKDQLDENAQATLDNSLDNRDEFTGEELLEMNLDEIEFLLLGFLQKVGLAAFIGSSDTGKSTYLRQLAMAIVLGWSHFLGFKINARTNEVIYVCTEDDAEAIAVLLKKQNRGKENSALFKRLRFIFSTEQIIAKLDKQLGERPADLVIIDAIADLFPGDFNAISQVRKFMAPFHALAKKHKCLILFMHHTGKKTEFLAPSKNNAIGSQGFEGKARVVAELRRDVNDSSLRHLCLVKGNYIPESNKDKSFVLKFDGITFTETGDRVAYKDLVLPKKISRIEQATLVAKEKVWELKSEGLSVRKIRERLRKLGFPQSKSTVDRWLKERPAVPKSLGNGDTGQPTTKEIPWKSDEEE